LINPRFNEYVRDATLALDSSAAASSSAVVAPLPAAELNVDLTRFHEQHAAITQDRTGMVPRGAVDAYVTLFRRLKRHGRLHPGMQLEDGGREVSPEYRNAEQQRWSAHVARTFGDVGMGKHVTRTPTARGEEQSQQTSSSSSSSSSSTHHHHPAAVAPDLTVILGMAYLTEEEALHARQHVMRGTTSSNARDRARILSAEKKENLAVVSFSRDRTVEECVPGRHFQGDFGRRAVRGLMDVLRQLDGVGNITRLYADYWRMPPQYISCLRLVLTEMVPKMVHEGIMDESSHIILPNSPAIFKDQAVIAAVRAGFPTPNGRKLYLLCEPIPRDEYPLYVATDDVDPMLLNALSEEHHFTSHQLNEEEVQRFGDEDSRFLRFELTMDEVAARAHPLPAYTSS
jgi:hypothetical protein